MKTKKKTIIIRDPILTTNGEWIDIFHFDLVLYEFMGTYKFPKNGIIKYTLKDCWYYNAAY